MIGQTLSHYKVVEKIGSGGMGEVYKAKDTRLDRTVAIKVLPSHVANDRERRQRFEREARAVSSLNHPHICTLHEFDTEEGIDFLVMEYIEGETLVDRLKKGPLPLAQALRCGIEIVDALDNAHRQGVVHRDLKPGNIMLTTSGAKLLDFGLAKLRTKEQSGDAPVLSALPTEERPLTEKGSIIGTFQYMAPEQLEGKEADAKSDIFAFGSVLYEMVTGKRAFEGKSQASLIAAILERQPELISTIQPLTPPSLDRVMARCLSKDPTDRWSSARDVKEVLSWIGEEEAISEKPDRELRATKRVWLPWGIAAAAIIASIVALFVLSSSDLPEVQPVGRFVIAPSSEAPLDLTRNHKDLAISPNGEHLVYSGGNPQRLYSRRLSHTDITTLVNPDGFPRSPFFSVDSEWVGFLVDEALKKVSILGGPATTLCELQYGLRGASWGPNDDIVFATTDQKAGLLLIPAAGGEPQVLTVPDPSKGELDHLWPEFLPGGSDVLFDIISARDDGALASQIAVLSIETGDQKTLIPGGSNAQYTSSGHIVYAAEGTLRAVRFDLERFEIVGNPFPVVEKVNQKVSMAANYRISENGTLAFNPEAEEPNPRLLMWVDREGNITRVPLEPSTYNSPSLSADGRQLALSITDESGTNIWIYDIERRTLGKRTFGGNNNFPIFTPDGEQIFFTGGSGFDRLMKVRADGSSSREPLSIDLPRAGAQVPTSWSDVHRTLLIQLEGDTWRLSLDEGVAEPFLTHGRATVREARFSPDHNWVAYRSDETGRDEVYVVPYPGPGGKWQISTDGGAQPMWAPSGGELFYTSGNRMMVVSVETEPTFKASTPQILFETSLPEMVVGDPSRYGVSRDGQRFLIIAPAFDVEATRSPEIHVVVNWFEELKQLAP